MNKNRTQRYFVAANSIRANRRARKHSWRAVLSSIGLL